MTDTENAVVAATWSRPLEPPAAIPGAADVVIIGGGIVGVSTAWFLARQGVRVVLCEKGHIACEQSGRNWGWVRIQGRDNREIPMMQESLRIWEGLKEEIGVDVGFTRGGCYFTANTEKQLAAFDGWLATANEYGIDTRRLSRGEFRRVRGHAHDRLRPTDSGGVRRVRGGVGPRKPPEDRGGGGATGLQARG
jgi:glycine/D-amino acid oxidase-like deaminating enzyme